MVGVRPAGQDDAPDVQTLLRQLGYEVSVGAIRARLAELAERRTDPVLLASDGGEAVGLVAMHWSPMLHADRPVARITALVVLDTARGRGVGRVLVDHGAELARRAGCGVVELTTALQRTDAQAFYRAMGFTASSLRLHRPLAGG